MTADLAVMRTESLTVIAARESRRRQQCRRGQGVRCFILSGAQGRDRTIPASPNGATPGRAFTRKVLRLRQDRTWWCSLGET
jgi:hypothetical protein